MAKPKQVRTIKPAAVLAGGAPMQVAPYAASAAASPDGSALYTGHSDGAIRAWDARTGEHLATWQQPRSTSTVSALALHPDGSLLLAASGGGVAVRSVPSGELRATLTGFAGSALSLALLAEGDGVVVGSDDGSAYVLSLDGALRSAVVHGDAVLSLSAAPSAGVFATAGHHGAASIKLWRVDGASVGELGAGRSHPPTRVALSPEGDVLYAAYNARPGAPPALVAWEVARAAPRWACSGVDDFTDLALLDGGRRVVTAHQDAALRVWDAGEGTMVQRFACRALDPDGWSSPSCVAPRPGGGLFVALAYRRVARLSREASALSPDDPPRLPAHEGGVRALAFVGESAVVSLGAGGDVARWDLSLGDARVRAVVAGGAVDGIAAERAAVLMRTPRGVVRANGRTLALACSAPGEAFVEPEAVPSLAVDGGPTLALPNGRALVATRDAVAVVDRTTGEVRAWLAGLEGAATALAASSRGLWAAASDGASIVAWKVPR